MNFFRHNCKCFFEPIVLNDTNEGVDNLYDWNVQMPVIITIDEDSDPDFVTLIFTPIDDDRE